MMSLANHRQPLSGNKVLTKHHYFMQKAFDLASSVAQQGEVPVAAILVKDDAIIAETYNQPIHLCDPTAHAEVLALRRAAKVLNNYRLEGCELYVTLEPCVMCAGAMIHARIKELIFGAYDTKVGAVTNAFELFDMKAFNHQIQWRGGIMEAECSQLLNDFFQERRQ